MQNLRSRITSAIVEGQHPNFNMRKAMREARYENRRLEFVQVRRLGGGAKECARRRRQMGYA